MSSKITFRDPALSSEMLRFILWLDSQRWNGLAWVEPETIILGNWTNGAGNASEQHDGNGGLIGRWIGNMPVGITQRDNITVEMYLSTDITPTSEPVGEGVIKWTGTAEEGVSQVSATGVVDGNVIQVGGNVTSPARLNDLLQAGYSTVTHKLLGVVTVDVTTSLSQIEGSDATDVIDARVLAMLTSYGVSTSTEVVAIQNNTRVVRSVPYAIERPDDATPVTYRIELATYDEVGNMEVPDSAPTIALVNQSGADRSSRLDSTTMTLVSTGRYRAIYTSSQADAIEQLVWAFSVVEGGNTRVYLNTSPIVDYTAPGVAVQVAAIFNKLPTKSTLTGTNNTDGDTQLDEATGNTAIDLAIKAKTDQMVFTVSNRLDATMTDKTGIKLASDGIDAIKVELSGLTLVDDNGSPLTSINLRQAGALWSAAVAGKIEVDGNGGIIVRAAGNLSGPHRIEASGNTSGRHDVVLKVPA